MKINLEAMSVEISGGTKRIPGQNSEAISERTSRDTSGEILWRIS